jgi:hypothetical protein
MPAMIQRRCSSTVAKLLWWRFKRSCRCVPAANFAHYPLLLITALLATCGFAAKATVSVTSVSSTLASGDYKAGQIVPITVTFSAAVTAAGSPHLALSDGGTAVYSSGSGGATLTFNYNVGSSDASSHLDYASTSALTLSGGSITGGGGAASLTLPAPGAAGSLGANKNLVIDTTLPTVTISGPSTVSTNAGAAVSYTVSYFDINFGSASLTPANITLTNSAVTGTIAVTANNSTNFTVVVSGLAGVGTQAIQVVSGTATDLAGNLAPAAGPAKSFTVTAPSSIMITNVTRLTATLRISGVPDLTYRVLASDNLLSWSQLGGVPIPAGGFANFTDNNVVQHPRRFYRAVYP